MNFYYFLWGNSFQFTTCTSVYGQLNGTNHGAFIATKYGMGGEGKDELINTLVYLAQTSFDILSSSAGLNTRSLGAPIYSGDRASGRHAAERFTSCGRSDLS